MYTYHSPVFLIGNGQLSTELFTETRLRYAWPVLAVDGGANHLKDICTPEHIIGDLDSLHDQLWWEDKTTITHIESQDSTDLEKVLDHVIAPLYVALGFSGDRFDHNFEILHILKKYENKNVIFFAGNDIIFRLPSVCTLSLPPQTRISLYPLEKTYCESSVGLRYPIDGLILEQGELIGTSNETTTNCVTLCIDEGSLACVLNAQYYPTIITLFS